MCRCVTSKEKPGFNNNRFLTQTLIKLTPQKRCRSVNGGWQEIAEQYPEVNDNTIMLVVIMIPDVFFIQYNQLYLRVGLQQGAGPKNL